MQTPALAGAGLVLLVSVGVGTVAHELSHAAVLTLLGIECDLTIGLGRVGASQFDVSLFGTWAAVTPREISHDGVSAMRLSSVAPLILAVPFVAIVIGIAPDPLQADSLLPAAWTIGWLACSIPSPQDFSVFWHADQAIAEYTGGNSDK